MHLSIGIFILQWIILQLTTKCDMCADSFRSLERNDCKNWIQPILLSVQVDALDISNEMEMEEDRRQK